MVSLEAVDGGCLGEGLCEEEGREENDRGDVVEVRHPFIPLRDRGECCSQNKRERKGHEDVRSPLHPPTS